MHTISAEHHAFTFNADAEPVLRVQPDTVVRFETSPAAIERLLAAGEQWTTVADSERINALTGPVYIEGVEPGDAVTVEILAIETADWGWNAALVPQLDGDPRPPERVRRLPIHDGHIWISSTLSVPVRPMIGCLGLAPAAGTSSSLGPPFPWAGNYDLIQMCPGATAYFPAQVAGGLFSLGDLHAAMGDFEVAGYGIECVGAATVRLGVDKQLRLETPRLTTVERLYTVGLAERGQYVEAKRHAFELMVRYLTTERGLTPDEAIVLTSACVDLSFGGPAGAVVLASVPLNVLARN